MVMAGRRPRVQWPWALELRLNALERRGRHGEVGEIGVVRHLLQTRGRLGAPTNDGGLGLGGGPGFWQAPGIDLSWGVRPRCRVTFSASASVGWRA
jgi:hypothetical protein